MSSTSFAVGSARSFAPKYGQVLIAVEFIETVGESAAEVRVFGTLTKLVVEADQLLVGPEGLQVAGLLLEHQVQSVDGGQIYFGHVLICGQFCDAPTQAFIN